ncbi:hypothetical protein ACIKTA_08485, partial [Hansschlegelia beijingensis]
AGGVTDRACARLRRVGTDGEGAEFPGSRKNWRRGLAREALEAATSFAATILNAANEVAVALFLEDRIGFMDIPRIVAEALDQASRRGLSAAPATIDEAIALDGEARAIASACLLESRPRSQ